MPAMEIRMCGDTCPLLWESVVGLSMNWGYAREARVLPASCHDNENTGQWGSVSQVMSYFDSSTGSHVFRSKVQRSAQISFYLPPSEPSRCSSFASDYVANKRITLSSGLNWKLYSLRKSKYKIKLVFDSSNFHVHIQHSSSQMRCSTCHSAA